ncbi:MAG: hypothetical protein P8X55_07725 [Desulfosarcinaceae bacterium]
MILSAFSDSLTRRAGRPACRLCAMIALVLCLGFVQSAQALKMTEKDGIYFYFPEGETALVRRLVSVSDGMTAFLASRGLMPTKPLHVILDDKPG